MSIDRQEVVVLENIDEIDLCTLKYWKNIAKKAVNERGRFTVALSGGKTPVSFFKRLAEEKGALPWASTFIFQVDERFVASSHPDNNFRSIQENLVSKIDIPAENIKRIPVDADSAAGSAAQYEKTLKDLFRLSEDGFPRFDLIMLGIGEDGHTASLFPGDSALGEVNRLVLGVSYEKVKHERVTLTLPVLNNSRNIIFTICGENKAKVAGKIINEKDGSLPASHIQPVNGKLCYFLRKDAAVCLL
ncbi:6-phosphogluconolactonase [Candidatus Auribacterota bacterium]